MKLKIYNSLSKKIEEFDSIQEEVRIYSCGPTVYDFAHIGNIRAFLFADLLQLTIKFLLKKKVKWVMNITDIDDKTIKSINNENLKQEIKDNFTGDLKNNLRQFTNYYYQEFLEDIGKVGIDKKDFFEIPRATDYINSMIDLIRKIYENGFAYINDGNIYFDVFKWNESQKYGLLYNIDFKNFRKGERVENDEYEKEGAFDFVLWKEKKENEPFWSFELNGELFEGRPGWHLECSAMGEQILGLPFDIHTGGIDLKFPHHEDEIAQSWAAFGMNPVKYWCHNEFLEVEGKKMSKSLGNFFTLRDLINQNFDPLDIRFAMFSQHYRTKYNFTLKGIEDAGKARKKIQEYIWELLEFEDFAENGIDLDEFKYKFNNNLADDLNTPKAFAEIFSFINSNQVNNFSKENKSDFLDFIQEINNILKIFQFSLKEKEIIPNEILKLAELRFEAKKNKNWELADKLRNELLDLGFIIKDTKDNYSIEKK